MIFEEEFPSLKNKQKARGHNCSDPYCDSWDEPVPQGHYIVKEDVRKYCLDKQKEYNITSDEFNELFVTGSVTLANGLRLSALTKTTFGDINLNKFKQEHVLLWEYKQKVKEAILKTLERYTLKKQQEELVLGDVLEIRNNKLTVFEYLIKELGLEERGNENT